MVTLMYFNIVNCNKVLLQLIMWTIMTRMSIIMNNMFRTRRISLVSSLFLVSQVGGEFDRVLEVSSDYEECWMLCNLLS